MHRVVVELLLALTNRLDDHRRRSYKRPVLLFTFKFWAYLDREVSLRQSVLSL
jgi:hypothetical protein